MIGSGEPQQEFKGVRMNTTRADLISPLDILKTGIGPSSSHTMGPMMAALEFRKLIVASHATGELSLSGNSAHILDIELYGSLSATGKGHATDGALCAGIVGLHPTSADPDRVWAVMPELEKTQELDFDGHCVRFDPAENIHWEGWRMDGEPLPHPNTVRFRLRSGDEIVFEQTIISVGGGFVETLGETAGKKSEKAASLPELQYQYNSATEFVALVDQEGLAPWDIVIANQERLGLQESKLRQELDLIIETMEACIDRGLATEGILPGGLNVRRRAKSLYDKLQSQERPPTALNDLRPSVYAMAVNEENAAGGRVVTAPTNGSSGLIPAVWRTLREDHDLSRETLQNGLIVASVIGALVKVHASISGAEVGCQGEVGTSCAMAAAGAVAMLGGNVHQMEQAAEIGIEHHLGMTCDPIKGLVQVPCIERNAMGAVKALNAASLSLASDGQHLVSLDKALQVMKQTGLDMNRKYKETSTGGLALG